jgi:murein L,D-transpeptidase YcbB/YkuD
MAAALPVIIAVGAGAQTADTTGSITTAAPKAAAQSRLATHTEIIADRQEAAMVTVDSVAAMENAIQLYEEIVAGGGWPEVPKTKLELGVHGPGVITLRQRLVSESYLQFESLSADNPDVFDSDLADALRAFQQSRGLAATGKVDARTRSELNISAETRLAALRENLPRVSEYAQNLGRRNILVNIPAAQLETVENGVVYSRHNVVAGKVERPTPSLESKVSDIVFNPYWNAPASIVAKDLLPKYQKDPTFFSQMHIRIFDGADGPEVDPQTVDWANTPADRFVFRQDPGDDNALATMKINFANKFMVYMHDTPHRELFASNARYESSGCVRVDQVSKVVNWILQGQDGIDDVQIEMITASQETTEVKVADPPDVRFMYLTAWATRDGRVNFRPDIYGLDGTGFILGQPQPAGVVQTAAPVQ